MLVTVREVNSTSCRKNTRKMSSSEEDILFYVDHFYLKIHCLFVFAQFCWQKPRVLSPVVKILITTYCDHLRETYFMLLAKMYFYLIVFLIQWYFCPNYLVLKYFDPVRFDECNNFFRKKLVSLTIPTWIRKTLRSG